MAKFTVVISIYSGVEPLSKRKYKKDKLSFQERNQLINTMFNNISRKMKTVEAYTEICVQLEERWGIRICERTVMRALNFINYFKNVI